MRVRRFVVLALAWGALSALAAGVEAPPAVAQSATGRASVHLVRLLDEVPDSLRGHIGPVHEIRLRLVEGNVLLLKQHGSFIAFLPIERHSGAVDSLRYFYYIEGSPLLWLLPGSRERAIALVADGGEIRFNGSRLIWRAGPGDGWIYFPDDADNAGLKFSVVSGKSVDQADPRDTKYWVELGTPGASGF
jgi:hypothetical protein